MFNIEGAFSGKLKPEKQNKKNVTVAKKFTKEDGLINWKKSAAEIHNQVRSMVASPTAYTFFNGKMIKILKTKVLNREKNKEKESEITNVTKQGIEVKTPEGVLLIVSVKPESKAEMNAYDFANGVKIKPGMKFGV